MLRMDPAFRFRFTALILLFWPISARTVFLKISTAAAPPAETPPPLTVPAVIAIVAVSDATTFRSPVRVIITLFPVRAFVLLSAIMRTSEPLAAPEPAAAAATVPVMVSPDCALTARDAAVI